MINLLKPNVWAWYNVFGFYGLTHGRLRTRFAGAEKPYSIEWISLSVQKQTAFFYIKEMFPNHEKGIMQPIRIKLEKLP